jgi:hypothetical protein
MITHDVIDNEKECSRQYVREDYDGYYQHGIDTERNRKETRKRRQIDPDGEEESQRCDDPAYCPQVR